MTDNHRGTGDHDFEQELKGGQVPDTKWRDALAGLKEQGERDAAAREALAAVRDQANGPEGMRMADYQQARKDAGLADFGGRAQEKK